MRSKIWLCEKLLNEKADNVKAQSMKALRTVNETIMATKRKRKYLNPSVSVNDYDRQ